MLAFATATVSATAVSATTVSATTVSATTVSATAVSATAVSATAVSATAVSATAVSATAVSATAVSLAAADRCPVTAMDDRRAPIGAMRDRSAGMAAMPAVPAVAATPAQTATRFIAAPIPARPTPTAVIPAIMATEPNELRALDHIQAVGRGANRSWRDHRGRIEAHYRCTSKKNSCSRDRDHKFPHRTSQSLSLSLCQRRTGLLVPKTGSHS
jgi:hypothetical protein